MKLCSETLSILKNFASLNSNIVVKPGNVLKTLNPGKSVYAEATVAETFPVEFGVFDLNMLLATVSLFKDPVFAFEEKYVRIGSETDTNVFIDYYYSASNLLSAVPGNKSFKMPEVSIDFDISWKDITTLVKSASVLQVSDVCIIADDTGIKFKVLNKKDVTSNSFTQKITQDNKSLNFSLYLKMENLKLIPGDYKVSISKQNVVEFKNKNVDIRYCLPLESDSTWN